MKDKQFAYVETKRPPKTEAALASAIMQHWQSRYLYGKALIITDSPDSFARLARKRWGSIMQTTQQERASTMDADTLLSLTHAITRMQQMAITPHPPQEYPGAHFWCSPPSALRITELPRTCHTAYVCTAISQESQTALCELLPAHSIVVDFTASNVWNLPPKTLLDEKVHAAWSELTTFLQGCEVNTKYLNDDHNNIDAIDDAIDTLLDVSGTFLRHARHFQEVLHLAQPLVLPRDIQKQYDIANMLARRVALLTPSLLHHSFIQNNNDTFSLYDAIKQSASRESLTTAIARHISAGRNNLAQALERAFINNSLSL